MTTFTKRLAVKTASYEDLDEVFLFEIAVGMLENENIKVERVLHKDTLFFCYELETPEDAEKLHKDIDGTKVEGTEIVFEGLVVPDELVFDKILGSYDKKNGLISSEPRIEEESSEEASSMITESDKSTSALSEDDESSSSSQ